jgi:DMSO/TMAO reductase YedYZ molybdopterin-dependent catalytic subunit
VRRPLALTVAQLDRGDALTATLDCTGGFFSTQHWRGVSLGRLLDDAGVEPAARHVRVISRTGYRWSFGLRDARALLLATHVGGEPLAHGHGAPCRLVPPGRRWFQWVKWVERIEVHEIPTRAPSPRHCGAASPPRGAATPDRAGGTEAANRARKAGGRGNPPASAYERRRRAPNPAGPHLPHSQSASGGRQLPSCEPTATLR